MLDPPIRGRRPPVSGHQVAGQVKMAVVGKDGKQDHPLAKTQLPRALSDTFLTR